jgi:hypothetical protein
MFRGAMILDGLEMRFNFDGHADRFADLCFNPGGGFVRLTEGSPIREQKMHVHENAIPGIAEAHTVILDPEP